MSIFDKCVGGAALSFLCAGVLHAATSYPLADYFYPPVEGAEWHYTGKNWDGESSAILVYLETVGADLPCYTGRAAATEYTHPVLSFWSAYGEETEDGFSAEDDWREYASIDAGIYSYWGMDDDEEEMRADQGFVFPVSLSVGAKAVVKRDVYENGVYVGQKSVTLQLMGVETVTVTAGTFADCLHLRETIMDGSVHDEWWALGVGCVKYRGVSGGGAKQQRDLVSCSVSSGTTPMSVRKNGPGSIVPDLNGIGLVSGQSYWMTAAPSGTGVKFVNWTDASSGAVVTNGATVYFEMGAGKGLVANFSDTTRPTVKITAPTKAQKLLGGTNALFTVAGTAADNGGVASVMWQLNDGDYAEADLSNGGKNWSAQAWLAAGANTLRAYSVDLLGNVSVTQSVAFTYSAVGVPIAIFAKDAANVSLGYKGASGTWYYLDALEGLYCVSPKVGASSAMQVSVTGPGILSFGWELDGGDGTNALTCAVGSKVLATNLTDQAALLSSVAVPSGKQTVKWSVARGKKSGEVSGIVRSVVWTPLAVASSPQPEDGQALVAWEWEDNGLAWQSEADYCRVYAGLSSSSLNLIGQYEACAVPSGDLAALVAQADGATVYWRVDTVAQDANGNETVNKGTVWSLVVVPEGAPEFAGSQAEEETLMMGVQSSRGPYAVQYDDEAGALSCTLKKGALPPGLALTVDDGNVYVTGVPTKAGTYQAMVQLSQKVGTKTIPGTTMTLNLTVVPLESWAYGTFDGFVSDAGSGYGTVTMTVTAQGKVTGKLSYSGASYTFTANSYCESDEGFVAFQAFATVKIGTSSYPLHLDIRSPDTMAEDGTPLTPTVVEGVAEDAEIGFVSYRNCWKDEPFSSVVGDYAGYYTATLPGDGSGSGYLTFTVDASGGVKTVGKLADGTGVSMSGVLIMDGDGSVFTVVYASPSAYKGGCIFGCAQFVKPEVDGDEGSVFLMSYENGPGSFVWINKDPKAGAEYVPGESVYGYSYEMGLSGGWYSKISDLRTYYEDGLTVQVGEMPMLLASVKITDYNWDSESENPPKTSWTEYTEVESSSVAPAGLTIGINTAGTGFTVPKAQTPSVIETDPETGQKFYNYDELENPSGFKLSSFAAATGIFKGSFNIYYDYASAEDYTKEENGETWSHTSISAPVEGVLTLVGPDVEEGIAGRGFYTVSQKALYDTGKINSNDEPVMGTYTYTGSYDFVLMSDAVIE